MSIHAGGYAAGKQFVENDLGILADTKLIMSRQSVLAAKRHNGILVCIRESIINSSGEVIASVLCC